jgi:hypothetical protein
MKHLMPGRIAGVCSLVAAAVMALSAGAMYGQVKVADNTQTRPGAATGGEDNIEFFTQKVRPRPKLLQVPYNRGSWTSSA